MSEGKAEANETDVTADSSTAKPEAKADTPEDLLEAGDLNEIDAQTVPYQRFREVNEKAKTYEKQLGSTEQKYQDDLRRITAQYEAKLAAHQSMGREDDTLDFEDEDTAQIKGLQKTIKTLSGELNSLKSAHERQNLDSQLRRLSKQFPKADKLAVQGWHMVYPEASVEELMEKSHNDNVNLVKSSLNDLIEKKKARAQKAVPISSPKIVLKDEEKPKSFEEASRMANKFLNSL